MIIYPEKIELLRIQFEKLKAFEKNIDKVLQRLLKDGEALYIQMNKDNLDKGLRSDGTNIRPKYSPTTIQIKRAKGQPTNRVTWKDTGALYRSLRIEHRDDEIEFVVNVPYYAGQDGLKEKYTARGVDGLGLPVSEIIKDIKPKIMDELRSLLFSKKSLNSVINA